MPYVLTESSHPSLCLGNILVVKLDKLLLTLDNLGGDQSLSIHGLNHVMEVDEIIFLNAGKVLVVRKQHLQVVGAMQEMRVLLALPAVYRISGAAPFNTNFEFGAATLLTAWSHPLDETDDCCFVKSTGELSHRLLHFQFNNYLSKVLMLLLNQTSSMLLKK